MRGVPGVVWSVALTALALCALGCSDSKGGARGDEPVVKRRPNIVVILADDLGFGDFGAYGARFGTVSPAPTPHLDALAAEGLMFTQAHSANGVCTPSR